MEGHDCEVEKIIQSLDHVVPSFVQAAVAEWRQPPRSIGDALAQLRAETDKTSNSLFPEEGPDCE